jgi:hypothetical protein
MKVSGRQRGQAKWRFFATHKRAYPQGSRSVVFVFLLLARRRPSRVVLGTSAFVVVGGAARGVVVEPEVAGVLVLHSSQELVRSPLQSASASARPVRRTPQQPRGHEGRDPARQARARLKVGHERLPQPSAAAAPIVGEAVAAVQARVGGAVVGRAPRPRAGDSRVEALLPVPFPPRELVVKVPPGVVLRPSQPLLGLSGGFDEEPPRLRPELVDEAGVDAVPRDLEEAKGPARVVDLPGRRRRADGREVDHRRLARTRRATTIVMTMGAAAAARCRGRSGSGAAVGGGHGQRQSNSSAGCSRARLAKRGGGKVVE